MSAKRLYRSRNDRMIAGVAGGLGEYFAIDPIIVRLLFVLLTIGGGAGVLLYIVAWIIIPEEGAEHETKTAKAKDADTDEDREKKFEQTVESKAKMMADDVQKAADRMNESGKANTTAGLVLLVLGILFLLQNLTDFDVWGNFWPLIIIAFGVGIILKSAKRS